ncbi:MAG: hypothetical protein PWQ78_948 [Petrotoga sp.]|nr:hypothetical protein [Petrotoga sp.]
MMKFKYLEQNTKTQRLHEEVREMDNLQEQASVERVTMSAKEAAAYLGISYWLILWPKGMKYRTLLVAVVNFSEKKRLINGWKNRRRKL